VEIQKLGVMRENARTEGYKYHACLPSGDGLIRYCGPDEHRPYHHKHLDTEKPSKIIKIDHSIWGEDVACNQKSSA